MFKTIFTSSLLFTSGMYLAAVVPEKMNVVLIMADDVGFECINAYGSTYSTPAINRMAQQGILFQNCHSQPLSTPSRVQIMTGMYNNRNYTQFGYLDPKQKTFAHLAKEAGYTTCIAGKWQLGADSRLPGVFGFDSYCLWQLSQSRDKGERYANVLYEEDGEIKPRDMDVYGPDVFADYLIGFMKKNKDKPFFAYYPMVLSHDPFFPTSDSEEWQESSLREKENLKHFPGMIAYMDKNVGKILDFLEKEGLKENTLVIFTGDNGTSTRIVTPMQDGHQIRGGKKGTKTYATHVPLIVCGPRITKGKTIESLVDFSDFYPTLRDVFGLAPDGKENLDGISFYPQLRGDRSTGREWSFCHYQNQNSPDYTRFVQTVEYKLYLDGRFYNKKKDVDENIDIQKGTPEEERLRKKLQSVLDQYPVWGIGMLTKASALFSTPVM